MCTTQKQKVKVSLKSLFNLVDPTMWFPSAPVVALQGAESKSRGNSGSYNNYCSALSVTGFASQDTKNNILISQVRQERERGYRTESKECGREGFSFRVWRAYLVAGND